MKDSKKSIKSLKLKAWKLCSEYIRRRDGGRCYTCGASMGWKNCDSGHFIHGHNKLTFFEPDNIHAQCKRCNLWLHGNESIYTLRMLDQYGRERVDELFKISRNGKVHTRKDILYWIEFYETKLDELKNTD